MIKADCQCLSAGGLGLHTGPSVGWRPVEMGQGSVHVLPYELVDPECYLVLEEGIFSQFYWDIKSSWCTLQISYRYLTVLSDPWVLIKPLLPQTTNTWAPGTWQLCHALHTHTCIFEEVSGGCTQWLTALILLMLFAGLMTAMAGNHTGVTLSPGKWGHWAGQPPLNTLPSTPSLPAAAWYPIGVVGVLSGRLCCSSGALHFK